MAFIRSLRRPLHEKVLVAVLMSAGLGATVVAVLRMLFVVGVGLPNNEGPYHNMVQDLLWGFELTIGILAASVPTLKAPIHNKLLSWGVLRDREEEAQPSADSFLNHMTYGSHFKRQMRQLDTVKDGNNGARPYMYSGPEETDGRTSTDDMRVNDGTWLSTTV